MKLVLTHKQQEADGVFTLVFKAEEPTAWVAGQSIRLELPAGSYDIEERRFTISAAPYEKNIAITTRVTPGLFKQSLLELQQGDTLQAGRVEGDFVWHESDKPHIFVAGGIGITPFYAMLKDRAHQRLSLYAHLLYAGELSGLPFVRQLKAWQQSYPEFEMTHIDRRVVLEDVANREGSLIYISGPTPMVTALEGKLQHIRQVPKQFIKTDQFTGYR